MHSHLIIAYFRIQETQKINNNNNKHNTNTTAIQINAIETLNQPKIKTVSVKSTNPIESTTKKGPLAEQSKGARYTNINQAKKNP